MTAQSFNGSPELIQMKGNIAVYRVPHKNRNTFYWFENDRLIRIDQGDLPHIRYQIELINK